MNEFFPKSNWNQSDQTQEINPVVNNVSKKESEKTPDDQWKNNVLNQKENLNNTWRPYPSLDSPEAQEMIKNAETINFTVHPLYELLFEDLQGWEYQNDLNGIMEKQHYDQYIALLNSHSVDFNKIFMHKSNEHFNNLRIEINNWMKVSWTFFKFLDMYEELSRYNSQNIKNSEITVFHLPNYKELNTHQIKAISLFLKSLPNQNQIIVINSESKSDGIITDKDRETLRWVLHKNQAIILRWGYREWCVADASAWLIDIAWTNWVDLHTDYLWTTEREPDWVDYSNLFGTWLSKIPNSQKITSEFIQTYLIQNRQIIQDWHNKASPYFKKKFDTMKGAPIWDKSCIYEIPFDHIDIEKWLDENIKEMK